MPPKHDAWYHTNTSNKQIHFFSCSNYEKDFRGTCKNRHYIRADAIEQIVKMELARLAAYLQYDEDAFAELLAKKQEKESRQASKQMQDELTQAQSRMEVVARLFEKLYEDNVSGKVSDEWFMQLSGKYEAERNTLKQRIAELQLKLKDAENNKKAQRSFQGAVRKLPEMETLTHGILRELIDRIEVYEAEGKGKKRTQRVVIYYRFVGYLDVPNQELDSYYVAETRKGVAVEYIPKLPA